MVKLIERLRQFARDRKRAANTRPFYCDDQAHSYRLSGWPALPEPYRTAAAYGVLSTMSVRSVNRQWIACKARMSDAQVELLLQCLKQQQVLQTQPCLITPQQKGAACTNGQ